MPDRVGLLLQDRFSLQESIKLAQYAETRGFEAVWQAESNLSRDGIVPVAAYAATTSRIRVGTAVIDTWTRNVATIATTFMSLDDLAPDRLMCGLGMGYDPSAAQVGIRREKPLLAIRETVTALRALLTLRTVTMQGEFVSLHDVTLTPIGGRREPRYVPLYIGVTGPRLTALAGEIADGVILNSLVSPHFNEGVIAQLAAGAQQSGRSLDAIDRPQLIACAVDHDRQRALDAARRMVVVVLRQQPQMMYACGVRRDLLDEIAQVMPWPASAVQIDDAMRLVPDEVVQLLTAAGNAGEVRAKVREYIAAGATCPVLVPITDDVRYMIDVFADGYSQ